MCEAIIGALIGGIFSLIVCRLTLDSDKANQHWERFVAIRSEFNEKRQKLLEADALPGDEIGSGISYKDLSESEQEEILFLLSEVEKISEKEASYEESFFTIYENEMNEIFHLLKTQLGEKLGLAHSDKDIFEVTKTVALENKIHLNAQKLLMDYAKRKTSKVG